MTIKQFKELIAKIPENLDNELFHCIVFHDHDHGLSIKHYYGDTICLEGDIGEMDIKL